MWSEVFVNFFSESKSNWILWVYWTLCLIGNFRISLNRFLYVQALKILKLSQYPNLFLNTNKIFKHKNYFSYISFHIQHAIMSLIYHIPKQKPLHVMFEHIQKFNYFSISIYSNFKFSYFKFIFYFLYRKKKLSSTSVSLFSFILFIFLSAFLKWIYKQSYWMDFFKRKRSQWEMS